jgi:CBS domain-containing protein
MDFRSYIEEQQVRRVGHRSPVSVVPDASVAESVKLMRRRSVGCLLVVENDELVGIFTERDLLRRVLAKDATASFDDEISTVMTADPVVARADEALKVLLSRMYQGGFRHVPVLDSEDAVLGTISIKRVVSFLADQFAEAVYNLPPRPEDFGTAREGA